MSYKRLLANIFGCTPLPNLLNYFVKVPKILFYHGVHDGLIHDKRIQGNQIELKEFVKQISYLKKRSRFLSLDEFYSMLINNEPFKGDEIVLTFDDGYKNNLTVVAPYLQSLDIPFGVFICSENTTTGMKLPTFYIRAAVYNSSIAKLDIPVLNSCYNFKTEKDRDATCKYLINIVKTGTQSNAIVSNILSNLNNEILDEIDELYESENLMNWDEVSSIRDFNATIGSHGLDHTILHSNHKDDVIKHQIMESLSQINNKIGSCHYFAYPNGDSRSVGSLATDIVRNNYKLGFVVDDNHFDVNSKSLAQISRIGVGNNYYMFKTQLSVLC